MASIIERIHNLFNDPEIRTKLLTYRWPLAVAALLLLSFLMKAQYFWLGLCISLVGEALQVWCFASLNKKKELAARGPYVVVRNPMYIGRYFLILGAVAITGSFFLMLLFSVVYYFYMVNRVEREEVVLGEIFGEAYEDYCQQTNRFIPAWRELDREAIRYFRWDLFFKNNAHLNLIAVLAGYLIVYIWLF
ncbi:MAG: isoprenylcysteine carboxylmethyltransferase family protein [Deltaproteobacteria bacterium]|nr:isoprenylcysteine carboxylmethyltransferase family protein [Deltaproteobacteria bacterium]